MVLGHSHRRQSAASPQKGRNGSGTADDHEDATEDETVVDEEQGNILGHIISQLRPGADLSRVTLPTFFLEPRSMLERITNFMAHPEALLPIPQIDDPVERFVAVVKFYLSGWHIKPPGVKKPLNPILGEIFTGYWDYSDGSQGYYVSEQTSHHPPKSSYFFAAPAHNIRADGTLKPRSKFLGNSAASMMEGIAILRFTNRNERYFITQPNMYARGILFGKMKYELGDHSFVRCPETGLVADLEFKTKGYFSGMYNAIGGYIKDAKTDKNLFELSGLWSGEMFIKNLSTGKKELIFDATHAKETPPTARPIDEQEDIESQRLWSKVNQAIKARDQNVATDEKTIIENAQRQRAAKRAEEGVEWTPRLFRAVQGAPGGSEEGEEDLDWIINAQIDGKTPEEIVKQVLAIHPILPGQSADQKSTDPARKTSEPTSPPTEQASIPQAAAFSAGSAGSAANPPPQSPVPTGQQQSTLPRSAPDQLPQSAAQTSEPIVPKTSDTHPLSQDTSSQLNGLSLNSPVSNDTTQRPTTRHQPVSEADLAYHDIPKHPPGPNEQMIDSMKKLKVGEPKEQAAALGAGQNVVDPLSTPKALPRRDEDVDREVLSPGAIQRKDSRTSEIDEFVDAED